MNDQVIWGQVSALLPDRARQMIGPLSADEIALLKPSGLGLSSLESIEWVMKVEERFAIELNDADLLQISMLSIGRMVDIIKSRSKTLA